MLAVLVPVGLFFLFDFSRFCSQRDTSDLHRRISKGQKVDWGNLFNVSRHHVAGPV